MNEEFNSALSVNALASPLVDRLIEDADQLRISVRRSAEGCKVVDAGIDSSGSFEAGRRIAEICMAGLGHVSFRSDMGAGLNLTNVEVVTSQPVISCLGSQYAGWSLECSNGKTFRALGSGPARALAQKEKLFQHIGYRDEFHRTCLVIETGRIPPEGLARRIAQDCGVEPESLIFILTPTGSPAGVAQIAARVVEVALHKAHELGFDLQAILEGSGSTPLPPPIADSLTAMGRTNDTILFAGQVALLVNCGIDSAEQLANDLPSSNSRDYGTPFALKFAECNYDFFEIDPMLFSPARVAVTDLTSGRTFFGGKIDLELLEKSFFGQS